MTIAASAPEGFPTEVDTVAYLGDSGIVFGQTDEIGVEWTWNGGNAWGPKPGPREESGDRAYDHGQWDATRFYGPRAWSISGTATAPNHAALHWAEQRLRNAIGPSLIQLRIVEPGFDGYALVRQQGQIQWTEDGQPDASGHPTRATWSIGLYAPDPLIYSTLELAFDLVFPAHSGGLEWPVTWPATWDGISLGGSIVVTNPSSLELPLVMTAYGPLNNLRIANTTTGKAQRINNPDGDTLTAGQTLTIDSLRRQLLLMGTASRRGWASGDWITLAPGDNTLAITGDATDDDSHVAGSFRAVRI